MRIAILGGTGSEGAGLGLRWAASGHEVIIGSRNESRARDIASKLIEKLPIEARGKISGAGNFSAADGAELVVLSTPFAGQQATLAGVKEALEGKLLITVVVPLRKPVDKVWIPEQGPAAVQAQAQLGDGTRVVAAFQNISAEHLKDPNHEVEADVLVCGDKAADRRVAIGLAADAGMRGIHTGSLANAAVAEGLTAALIAINKCYRIKDAGIRITGIPDQA